MSESHEYRIDYDHVDVEDLVRQIRARVHRPRPGPALTGEVTEERLAARLHTYLDVGEARALELQTRLGLRGSWNVTPEDLRASHPNLLGRLISGLRRLARPLTKLLVNADLPLHKQFRINLGLAAALHDLMKENADLHRRLEELSIRLGALDEERD